MTARHGDVLQCAVVRNGHCSLHVVEVVADSCAATQCAQPDGAPAGAILLRLKKVDAQNLVPAANFWIHLNTALIVHARHPEQELVAGDPSYSGPVDTVGCARVPEALNSQRFLALCWLRSAW